MSNSANSASDAASATNHQESPEGIRQLNVPGLFKAWQAHDAEQWSKNIDLFRACAARALNLGEPILAYDAATEGLKTWPKDVRLRQLHALSLARTGATLRANALLVELRREGHQDEETLGLLARTYKDLWQQAPNEEAGRESLRQAEELYREAYKLSGGYWTGINAATLALLLGEKTVAPEIADDVRRQCLSEISRIASDGGDDYWPLATLGEAALIRGEWAEAEDWYRRAAAVVKGRYAELASTRRNARLIAQALGRDRESVEPYFNLPRVVIFTGHMIDNPDRDRPRFPPLLEDTVRDAIHERLRSINAGFGFSSAACGSDILFLEAMSELGGETHIVLPCEREQFINDSVERAEQGGWADRFETAMRRATSVTMASDQKLEGGSASYEYANQLIQGLARIKAEQIETELVPLAVWNGEVGDGRGGTSSVIEEWRKNGLEVQLIDLAEILRQRGLAIAQGESDAGSSQTDQPAEASGELKPQLMSMLFADAVNFSKLTETQLPLFLDHFLGLIGEQASTSPHAPLMKNTWGDGLFFVFSTVSDAGQFALDLCRRLNQTNWAEKGLPEGLSLRIALHAGPVYACLDPVTGRPNFFGTHVSRAARLEPITPAGHVYSSQAFAALAAAQGIKDFKCDYVGQTPLAKKYGTFPTYHVHPLTL